MHEKTSSGLLLVSRDKIKIHLSDSKANLIHRAHQSIISSESVIWSYEQFPLEKKTHTLWPIVDTGMIVEWETHSLSGPSFLLLL